MVELKYIRTLLIDRGWTGALVEAGIASPVTVHFCQLRQDLFLSTSTRRAHQITAYSLYKLLRTAHAYYTEETVEIPEELLSFEAWCEHRKQQSPQFHFVGAAGDPLVDPIVEGTLKLLEVH